MHGPVLLPIYRALTRSNLFNLDLTLQGPPVPPYMLKCVHYVACTDGKRAVGIGLKYLLAVRCALPLLTEYSNMAVTLNTVDTRYVHWRHIPRVEVKVNDNQYIYIINRVYTYQLQSSVCSDTC